ncbi:tRNA-binding protein [Aurantibacter aestuarii]|uniref:tRNA-binding protein n=1 Tax=Aurantibacter aestuarii TaxID=1266046 RepID=A0A2T1N523_9FLAO|nr:tRNA-binding protein [Aurantibacter aestuarii]PSG86329.1 tRNA-binding protein [Aurantibacter aestuarii]
MKTSITFEDFKKVDIRVGTVVKVEKFEKAKKPAFQIYVDFGTLGVLKTSAQLTVLYKEDDLLHQQVLAVVNFPKKQIANFMSECLILGAVNGAEVTILNPEFKVPNGTVVS